MKKIFLLLFLFTGIFSSTQLNATNPILAMDGDSIYGDRSLSLHFTQLIFGETMLSYEHASHEKPFLAWVLAVAYKYPLANFTDNEMAGQKYYTGSNHSLWAYTYTGTHSLYLSLGGKRYIKSSIYERTPTYFEFDAFFRNNSFNKRFIQEADARYSSAVQLDVLASLNQTIFGSRLIMGFKTYLSRDSKKTYLDFFVGAGSRIKFTRITRYGDTQYTSNSFHTGDHIFQYYSFARKQEIVNPFLPTFHFGVKLGFEWKSK